MVRTRTFDGAAYTRLIKFTDTIEISAVVGEMSSVIDAVPMIDTGFANRATQRIPVRPRSTGPNMISFGINRPVHMPQRERQRFEKVYRRSN